MKLDRSILGAALAAFALSLACGCSATPAPAPRTASLQAATTQLTAADAFARTPKVGKAQLVADEDLGGGSVATDSDELTAPKEPRRATRHARGGYFGTSK